MQTPWDKTYGTSSPSQSPLESPTHGLKKFDVPSRYKTFTSPSAAVAPRSTQPRKALGERIFASRNAPSVEEGGDIELGKGSEVVTDIPAHSSSDQKYETYAPSSSIQLDPSLKRNTRQIPQTELQLLTTASIWFLLILPVLMSLLVLCLPSGESIHVDSLPLVGIDMSGTGSYSGSNNKGNTGNSSAGLVATHDCSSQEVDCQQYFLSDEDPSGGAAVGLLLHPTRTVTSMGFLEVSINTIHSMTEKFTAEELSSVKVVITPVLLTDSTYVDFEHVESGVDHESFFQSMVSDQQKELAQSIQSNVKHHQFLGVLGSNSESYGDSHESISLLYTIFAAPNLVVCASENSCPVENNWVEILVSIMWLPQNGTSANSSESRELGSSPYLSDSNASWREKGTSLLNQMVHNSVLKVVTQSSMFLFFEASLRLGLSIVTVCLYWMWWSRCWPLMKAAADLVPHPTVAADGSTVQLMCSRFSQGFQYQRNRLYSMCCVLLPEQLTSVWMLFFLLLWQSPLTAINNVAKVFDVSVPESLTNFAEFCSAAAKYGLFFCAWVYIDGLKYFPGDSIGVEVELEDSLEDDADDSSQDAEVSKDTDLNGNYALLQSSLYERTSKQRQKPRGVQTYKTQIIDERTPLSPKYPWRADALHMNMNDNHIDEFDRCDMHGMPLTAHHVLSTEFLDFLYDKVVLLLLSWMSVLTLSVYQKRLMSDLYFGIGNNGAKNSMSATSDGMKGEQDQVMTSKNINVFISLGLISQFLVLYWLWKLFSAARSTNRRLKKMPYGLSRFRQLAFRLFQSQFYAWAAFILVTGMHRWRDCWVITEQNYSMLSSSYALLLEPLIVAGHQSASGVGFRREQLQALIYLSSDYLPPFGFLSSLLLVSLSALCYTIAYTLTPPESPEIQHLESSIGNGRSTADTPLSGLVGGVGKDSTLESVQSSHAFVPLERNMPPLQTWEFHDGRTRVSLLELNPKLAYARLQRRVRASLKKAALFTRKLRGPSPGDSGGNVGHQPVNHMCQPFCLQTACMLLEVSFQSYFRPSGANCDVPECFDYEKRARTSSNAPLPAPTDGDSSDKLKTDTTVLNPFDSESDEETHAKASTAPTSADNVISHQGKNHDLHSASQVEGSGTEDVVASGERKSENDQVDDQKTGKKWVHGPAMDLQRCKLRLLSTFYNEEYLNLGFVCQTDTAATEMADEQTKVPGGGGGEMAVLPTKLTICYRGTTEVSQAINDFKWLQTPLPDLKQSKSFFRRSLREKIRSASGVTGKTKETQKIDEKDQDQKPKSPGVGSGNHLTLQTPDSAVSFRDRRTRLGDREPLLSPESRGNDDSPIGLYSPVSPNSPYDELDSHGENSHEEDIDNSFSGGVYGDGNESPTGVVPPIISHSSAANKVPRLDAQEVAEQQQLQQQEQQEIEAEEQARSCLHDVGSWACRVASHLPVIQQALPLVHRGFMQMYMNIRIQALGAVVHAMYTIRRERRRVVSTNLALQEHLRQSQASPAIRRHSSMSKQAPISIPPLELQFCGHSLGGVLALFTAYDVSLNLPTIIRVLLEQEQKEERAFQSKTPAPKIAVDVVSREPYPHISLYSFGQPKPGNVALATHVATYIHTHYRVELDGDIITTIPPTILGLSGVYVGAGTQVLVDPHAAGTLVVNPTIVESWLLAGHHPSAHKHTMERYRNCLLRCFSAEELEEHIQWELDATNGRSVTATSIGGGARAAENYLEAELAKRLGNRLPAAKEIPSWMF